MSDSFWATADEFLENFEYEQAAKVFQAALKTHPNNPEILDALGDTLLLMGDAQQALKILKVSLHLAPNSGVSKFLNLGQLHEGKEALKYYSTGAELLQQQKKNSNREDVAQIHEKLVSALCAMAEIYMTDECMADDAEDKCDEYLSQSLAIAPNSSEALQLMASFKISQQNNEEALEFLERSRKSWIQAEPEDRPPFDFRLQAAKLFIELEGYQHAAEILEMLLEEFDENAEVWYLLGFVETYTDPESALESLTKARELLVKTKCSEPEIFAQVDSQLQKVKEKIARLPPKPTTTSTLDGEEDDEDNKDDEGMDTTQ